MIESVEIKGLRGIREGTLSRFAGLNILVGPNGSGKSTILDAVLLTASPKPLEALRQCIRRHSSAGRVGRWLFWRGGDGAQCDVTLKTSHRTARECRMTRRQNRREDKIILERSLHGRTCHVEVEIDLTLQGSRLPEWTETEVSESGTPQPIPDITDVRLIDASVLGEHEPLHDLYSEAVRQGRAGKAHDIIAALLPGLVRLEILTEDGTPNLHLVFEDHSLPAGTSGDGVRTLLRQVLELASRTGGVVLLEEPEVHQHPAAIRQTAAAILAAMRRGIQIILTTHSLELIDALFDAASDDDLEKVAVFRLLLEDGVLKSSRLPGSEAAFARREIEDDLR